MFKKKKKKSLEISFVSTKAANLKACDISELSHSTARAVSLSDYRTRLASFVALSRLVLMMETIV